MRFHVEYLCTGDDGFLISQVLCFGGRIAGEADAVQRMEPRCRSYSRSPPLITKLTLKYGLHFCGFKIESLDCVYLGGEIIIIRAGGSQETFAWMCAA